MSPWRVISHELRGGYLTIVVRNADSGETRELKVTADDVVEWKIYKEVGE